MNTTSKLVLWRPLFWVIAFLLFHISVLGAVNPPELRCASVNLSGNTTITWIPPSDPSNEFQNYVVFGSNTLVGPYVPVNVGGLATSQYLDPNNANLNKRFFFVQTVYDDGSGPTSSVSSDTIQSILPVFAATSDSTCTLTWNPIFDPNIPSNNGAYTIFRRIGVSGAFTAIGNSNFGNENFDDSFKVCTDSIYYYVEISDQLGCISRSAILKDLFEDNIAPATPFIDSITVDPNTQQVSLNWRPSSSLDTEGYVVLYYDVTTPQYIILSTLTGRLNTTYAETSTLLDPNNAYRQYTIAAFDSCAYPIPNTSAGADDQRTIFLDLVPDLCANQVHLFWNSYINWVDLEGYEISFSVNGGGFSVLDSVGVNDTTYYHENISGLNTYCYKIKAFTQSASKSSTSNEKCALSNAAIIPSKHYMNQVTVRDNSSIHTSTLTDSTLPVSFYILERSLERFDNFFEVGRSKYNENILVEIDDFEASVDETDYYYRVGILDTCGELLYTSPVANSLHLEGAMNIDSLKVTLQWNDYLGWDTVNTGVGRYMIYRVLDGNRELIDSVDRFTLRKDVYIEPDIQLGAKFCFEIEAREDSGSIYNRADTGVSNRVCFSRNLNVFVPNAFRPQGENNVFKPVLTFGELATYRLVIYDRWGNALFETDDYFQGWDGNTDGKPAPFDAYVYYLEASNFAGATFTKSGTFVLLQ